MSIFAHLAGSPSRTHSADPPAKRGRKFTFHGAFKHKTGPGSAQEKERATPGSFIQERKIRGATRYVVLTENK